MKNIAIVFSMLFFAALADFSYAASTGVDSPHALRLDLSYNSLSAEYDLIGDPSTDEFSQEAWLTFNPNSRFLAELGFLRFEVDKFSAFGRPVETDADYESTVLGIGYRVPRKNQQERFVGIGLRVYDGDNDSGLQPDVEARGFIEKDTAGRYGQFQIAYSVDSNRSLTRFSGRHVWFLHPSVGLGVNWAFALGTRDDDSDLLPYGTLGYQVGAILMLRARY